MAREPIAIVGVGCRLPGGADDLPSAWRLVLDGTDAVTEVPPDRWDADAVGLTASGHTVPRYGAFLANVDRFDADLFGISPREARTLDPQQRLLLEVAWEALEDAGHAPDALQGTRTGVYVGMGLSDYARRHFLGDVPDRIDAWSGTGSFSAVAAGRIAYTLGLQGPALAVHTACSSSLVALHLAVQALRDGSCELALAGGVNLLLAPEPTVYFAELGALSPTGRCRTFDEGADGYVRGEGAGLFALERLSDAQRRGHPILAVVRGTAIGQDGRSNGLTAPSGRAQQQVIRDALEDAGLSADAVGYVQAHGTGTPLGDPIEMRALAQVYGPGDEPCRVRSVKTNVGHLEAAAGVAGVVDVLGALRNGIVPPHLHLQHLNPRIDLAGTRLEILDAATPWTAERRVAAISAFGLSGTNAHVVLEAVPAAPRPPTAERPVLIALSAHTEGALQHRLRQVRQAVRDGAPLADVGRAAAEGRAVHRHRLAVVARSADDLEDHPGHEARTAPEIVFAFTGQGSQHPAMGRLLYQREPVYRDAVDAVDAAWRAHMGSSLLEVLHADDGAVHATEWTQPCLFAVEWGLAALWKSWGITPDAVLGHSIGELVAAAVAGVWSLEDAVLVVAERGRLLGSLPRGGAMAAVRVEPDRVLELLDADDVGAVDVAAINGPEEVVLSGASDAVIALTDRLRDEGVKVTPLRVSHAFHSPLVEPVVDDFEAVIGRTRPRSPELPLYSCLTGRLAGDEITRPAFWSRHLRAPVRFADAVRAAAHDERSLFLELGPRRVLAASGSRTAPESTWLGTLQPDHDPHEQMLTSLGALWTRGARPNWSVVHRDAGRASLPPYPFQRERHWLDPLPPRAEPGSSDALVDRYRITWEAPADRGRTSPTGTWVVLGNPEGIGGALQGLLDDEGSCEAHCSPALPDATELTVVAFVDAPDAPSQPLERRLAGLGEAWSASVERTASLLGDPRIARLWMVVRGEPTDPVVAMLEGIGATAGAEAPQRWGGVVRVAPDLDPARAAEALFDALTRDDGEDRLAVVGGRRQAPRLSEIHGAPAPPPALRSEGIYLVTGGLGAVGLAVAGLLADLGARHLVLTSRRGEPDPDDAARRPVHEALAALRARDIEVRAEACDAADPAAVRALLRTLDRPLRGVVHAAGSAPQAPLSGAAPDDLLPAMAAKVQGAAVLDALTRDRELGFFVLLSSVAALWGSAGLGAYGAANHALHALARRRREEGLPGVAIAFGPWSLGGMVSPDELDTFARMGVHPLGTDAAVRTLGSLLGRAPAAEVVVADIDWDVFVPVVTSRRPQRLFERVRPSPRSRPTAAPSGLVVQLLETPQDDRPGALAARLRAEVAAVLGRDPDAPLDPGEGFFELGLDSVMAVELAERLRALTGQPLAATVAFDHPTLDALTTHVLGRLDLVAQDDDEPEAPPAPPAAVDEPVAIVGLACRFPGAASADAFWGLLRDGVDAVTDVPIDRYDIDSWYDPDPHVPGRTVCRTGGFLDDVAGFEPEVFGLSPREAAALDPQQRLLLEVSWEALEHAGIAPDALAGTRGGVWVGIGRSEYWPRLQRPADPDVQDHYPWSGTGNETAFAAGRVAFTLGLRGPALSLNTACSSSLVAVHEAVRALRTGEASLALAGGVNLLLSPESTVYLSQLRALSPSGRCRTFDAEADGYVRGEGCGMIVLKRLSDARRDGDRVLAVVRGTAVGHDGHSSGLTVPSGPAQQDVLKRALRDAEVRPAEVTYVEAHGTGTSLGDPIEVGALKEVLGRDRTRPLHLGAVKTNIGHLETAAGIAGVIKVVLMLQHGQIPATLHLSRLNPALPLDFPVRVPTHAEAWPEGPRVAGVSSFGMSGTNAHVVIAADAPGEIHDDPEPDPGLPVSLLALSGRTPPALEAQRIAVRRALKHHDLAQVASTLAHGRAAERSRLTVVGRTVDEARAALREPIHTGRVEPGSEPRVGFLLTGQGAQYPGMLRDLVDDDPVVREAVDDGLAEAEGLVDVDVLRATLLGDDERIHDTRYTQPALLILQWALAARFRALGVRPTATLGHSVGEIGAAAVAGLLSLSDALTLACGRAALMAELPGGGAMAAALAPVERVQPLVGEHDELSIAAVNGPNETVFSGDADAVREVTEDLEHAGVEVRPLTVSHAFHSPRMTPILDDLAALASRLETRPARCVMVSALDAEVITALPPEHWVRHARAPVRFADALQVLAGRCDVLVELGPRPVLSGMGARLHPELPFLPALRRDRGALDQLLDTAGALWTRGVPVDPRVGRPRLPPAPLPTTAWQRRRLWIDAPGEQAPVAARPPLLHRVWQPAPPPEHPLTGRVVLIDDAGGLAQDLEAALKGPTVEATVVPFGAPLPPADHVISFRALDHGPADHPAATADALAVLKQVLDAPPPRPRLWWVTRGGVAVRDREPVETTQAGVWGLAATAALEHPELGCHVLDLDPDDDGTGMLDALSCGEPMVALWGGAVKVPRLRAVPTPAGADAPVVRDDAAYLVTGGTGALGRQVVRWLLEAGAGHVWVLARSEVPDEATELWRPHAERVTAVQADVADADQVAAVLKQIRSQGAPLAGVVHLAGRPHRGLLRTTDPDELAGAWAAKVEGAFHLHTLTHDLDLFVLFSSATGWLGLAGQGVYASANAALDGLASYRAARGMPAVSIAWGPWADGGMAAARSDADWEAEGVHLLPPDRALAALQAAIAGAEPTVAVFPADWEAFSRRWAEGPPPLLQGLPGVPTRALAPGQASTLVHRLKATRPRERHALLSDAVQQTVGRVLGRTDPGDIAPRQGFFDAGMDSLMAVQLARHLGQQLDLPLPPTVAFDHPDIEDLTGWLLEELELEPEIGSTEAPSAPIADDEPIAVVGIGCRFPGAASPDELWALLHEGRVPLTEVPRSRWDLDAWYAPPPGRPDRIYAREGGFLSDIDQFDPDFFGIAAREAESLDPQQRLLLEVSWEALERAGRAGSTLAGSRTGVFVGIADRGWLRRFQEPGAPLYPDAWAGTGSEPSFAPGRVAHALDLEGPALALNTTCSSSLVAVHLAAAALRAGECDTALAGGVHLQLTPDDTAYLCALGALSPTGRCHTFDARADGYVRGDGAGVVVLRRLSDAVAAGEPVLAVIRGSAVNHDGHSSGLTVPNGAAQEAVIREALARAGARPEDVGFLEAHGTGTQLGDPVEVRAALAVYGDRPGAPPLHLKTVKTNLGHTELAAGIAGLIEAVLVLQHRTVPPHPDLRELNPTLDLGDAATIPTRPTPWPEGTRLAGVSAFGLSGTNAHVLLEAGPTADGAPDRGADRPVHVLALSAASEGSLERLAGDLVDRGPLPDVAWTLHQRRPMPVRAAVVAASLDEAAEALKQATPHAAARTPRVAFLFSGQGSQVAGMALELLDAAPVLADTMERAATVLDPLLGRPLRELLADGEALARTEIQQPCLFAVEVGLARQWRAWGVEPDVVVGHSLGELAAACVAGVFSLEHGLRLVAERGRLMGALPDGGAMAAVMADGDTVRAALVDGVEIAALNHPEETTISGPAEGVDAVLAALPEVEHRRLRVSHAFHSPLVEPMLDAWEAAVREASPARPELPLISLRTGRVEDEALTDPSFWRQHARDPVLAADGLATVADRGVDVWLDVGPHPTLLALARRALADRVVHPVASQRRSTEAWRTLAAAMGALFEAGVDPDWDAWDAEHHRERVPLPTYPFDRRSFWLEEAHPACTGWTWEVRWSPAETGPRALPSSVAVVGDGVEALQEALTGAGLRVERADRADVVIDLRPLGGGALADRCLELVRAARNTPGRLVAITRRGMPDGTIDPDDAAIGGLLRTLALERGARETLWLDLGDGGAEQVLDALHRDGSELAWRDGWHAPHLHPVDVPATAPEVSGTWLITGGLGSLGLKVAGRLVARGAERLVLTARTPLPDRDSREASADPVARARLAGVEALEEAGATVITAAVDAGDGEAMEALLQRHPVDGVVHAAGITLPQPLSDIDADTLQHTLRAKVDGARVLDELTRDRSLQGFLLFSSIAATWGSGTLAAYGAANAWLDGLARARAAEGLPATSVAWGPWSDGGMVDAERAAELERLGLQLLPSEGALDVLEATWGAGRPLTTVARVDWPRFLAGVEAARPRALFDEVRPTPPSATPEVAPAAEEDAADAGWLAEVVALEPEVRAAALVEHLEPRARAVLRLDARRPLEPDTPLMELGFDSLMATELKNALLADGLDVPMGRLLGGPSLEEIATMVLARLEPTAAAAPTAPDAVAPSEEGLPPALVWTHIAAVVVGAAIASAVWALL